MSFRELYEFSQTLAAPVSRRQLRPKICDLARCPPPRVYLDGGMDPKVLRGLFLVPGACGSKFARFDPSCARIVIARNQSADWQRFIEVKELMHLFDQPLETVSSESEFTQLIDEFSAPSSDGVSEAFKSENLGYWMALAVLCPETHRQDLEREIVNGLNIDEVGTSLRLPPEVAGNLFRPNFKSIVQALLCR